MDQSKLNIMDRSRTSRLPWRGQFSPELVEYLMATVCQGRRRFLDPFAGSGTVMFEALREGKSAVGLEINPAAWHLAVLSSFSSLSYPEQCSVFDALSSAESDIAKTFSFEMPAARVLDPDEPVFHNLAKAAALIVGMANATQFVPAALTRGLGVVKAVLRELVGTRGSADCYLRDARQNALAHDTIDAVITSPPYINVFNYHQNYRTAVELLGWQPLEAARAEIGANRKHRQNRFMTVVQYGLDMHDCLIETARVMRADAPLIIVLGRTSNVLGTPFENGAIIAELIAHSGCYGDIHHNERVFLNRYGEHIVEDILVTSKRKTSVLPLADPRLTGLKALHKAAALVPTRNRAALDEAIAKAADVLPSRLLDITSPPLFIHGDGEMTWK